MKVNFRSCVQALGRYPLSAVLVAYVVVCLIGCKRSYVYQDINLSDLRTKTNFLGRVETLTIFTNLGSVGNFVAIGIVTPGEERVAIGDSGVSEDFVKFAQSMQEGQDYEFPKALLEFESGLGRELRDVRVKPTRQKVTIRRR